MQRWVITSAQNNTEVNKDALDALKFYCERTGAKLVVLPIKYNPDRLPEEEIRYSDLIPKEAIVDHTFLIGKNTYVLGDLHQLPTKKYPLNGLGNFGGDKHLIVASPKMHQETYPTLDREQPKFAFTTASITKPNYMEKAIGFHAEFNHIYGGVMVETDDEGHIFIRHLSYRNGRINDYDSSFNHKASEVTEAKVSAVVLGDLHTYFMQETISSGIARMIQRVQPSNLILHDVLDFLSRSHHGEKDHFRRFLIEQSGLTVMDELIESVHTVDMFASLVEKIQVHIVPSNHNDHLNHWLNRAAWQDDMKNATTLLELQLQMLKRLKNGDIGIDDKIPSAYDMFLEGNSHYTKKIKFIEPNGSLKIKGYELGLHGHNGINGARTLRGAHSSMAVKSITGHSHTTRRINGMVTVGVSAKLDRNYTQGLSTWSHGHAILFSNGAVQQILQNPQDGTTKLGAKGDMTNVIEKVTLINRNIERLPDEADPVKPTKGRNGKKRVYTVAGDNGTIETFTTKKELRKYLSVGHAIVDAMKEFPIEITKEDVVYTINQTIYGVK